MEIGYNSVLCITGDDGPQGEQGAKGIQGDKGLRGRVGNVPYAYVPPGKQTSNQLSILCIHMAYGLLHATFSDYIIQTNVGEKGDEGFVGLQGVQGAPGQKGETGYNGWKGEVGDYGLQGVMGIDGRPGNKLVTIIIDFLYCFKYLFYLSILKE